MDPQDIYSCSKALHLPLDLWMLVPQSQPGAPKAPKGDMPPKKPPIEPPRKNHGAFLKWTCHNRNTHFFVILRTIVGNAAVISQEKANKSDLLYAKWHQISPVSLASRCSTCMGNLKQQWWSWQWRVPWFRVRSWKRDAPQYSRLIQDLRNGRTVGQLLPIDAATRDAWWSLYDLWRHDIGTMADQIFTKELSEISSH